MAPATLGQGMAPATQRQSATQGEAQTAEPVRQDLESAASVKKKSLFSDKKQQHNYLSSYCWLWCFLQRELYLLWQQQPCGWNMQYGDLSLWRQHMSGNNKTEWEGTIINFSAIHINPMWYRFGWTLTPSLLLAPLQFLHQLPSALGKLEFSVASPLVLLWHPRQPSQ